MEEPLLDRSTTLTSQVTSSRVVERVFQIMSRRKIDRKLRGTYSNDRPWVMMWVALVLLLLFGLVRRGAVVCVCVYYVCMWTMSFERVYLCRE